MVLFVAQTRVNAGIIVHGMMEEEYVSITVLLLPTRKAVGSYLAVVWWNVRTDAISTMLHLHHYLNLHHHLNPHLSLSETVTN
jgi:hypothetical protein